MRELVIVVADQPVTFGNSKRLLADAARKAGISYRAAKAVFYKEITDPEHKVVRRLQEAAERRGKQEAKELATRFDTIARALDAADTEFYRTHVAALLDISRTLRGLCRTGTEGD